MVHRTGDENISGTKTVSGRLIACSHQIYSEPEFDSYTLDNARAYKSNGNNWFFIGMQKLNNGSYYQRMGIWNLDNSTFTSIGIGFDSDESEYSFAPTPSSAIDNSTKIATTAWVNSRITARLPQIIYW